MPDPIRNRNDAGKTVHHRSGIDSGMSKGMASVAGIVTYFRLLIRKVARENYTPFLALFRMSVCIYTTVI